MEDHEQVWDEFWKEICTNPDGTINLDQIKRELFDYRFMLHEVPKVYVAVTNGLLSKPNYYANEIIGKYEDYINEFVEKQKLELITFIDEEINDCKPEEYEYDRAYADGLARTKEIINENI
jgi:hypothetical protein